MKYDGKYVGSIKHISVDNFCCIYWSIMQIHIYKQARRYRMVDTDLTGTVAQPISNPNGDSYQSFFISNSNKR